MEIKHKITPRQLEVIEAMKTTGNLKELQKLLRWKGKELANMIGYLNQKRFIRRVSKSRYELNYDYLYNERNDTFEPVQIDGIKIDLNQIPKEVQEYIWNNRHLTCSELRKKTTLPRFHIRQYLYERKMKEFPNRIGY